MHLGNTRGPGPGPDTRTGARHTCRLGVATVTETRRSMGVHASDYITVRSCLSMHYPTVHVTLVWGQCARVKKKSLRMHANRTAQKK